MIVEKMHLLFKNYIIIGVVFPTNRERQLCDAILPENQYSIKNMKEDFASQTKLTIVDKIS